MKGGGSRTKLQEKENKETKMEGLCKRRAKKQRIKEAGGEEVGLEVEEEERVRMKDDWRRRWTRSRSFRKQKLQISRGIGGR